MNDKRIIKLFTEQDESVLGEVMKKYGDFCLAIAKDNTKLTVKQERSIVKELNDFFFASHVDLGTINCLGRDFKYFSDFHKYWHKHHKKILYVSICDENCEKVAENSRFAGKA